jgi:hypothetical protein
VNTEIRSYRRVFELERRIYRIDQLRLNPAGVPLRSVAYLAIAATGVAALSRVPLVGLVLRMLPWYARFAGLPLVIAALLSVIRVEGRPFHLAAFALARCCLQPRWSARFARCEAPGRSWCLSDVLVVPDGSEARPLRVRYAGPGLVVATTPRRAVILGERERVVLPGRRGAERR